MLDTWEQRGIPQLLEQFRRGSQPSEALPATASPALQPLARQRQLAGSKRALAADINGLHAFASNIALTQPPAAGMDAATTDAVLDAVIGDLESNLSYAHKIKTLATETGWPPSALQAIAHKAVELSRRVRPRPPETRRSAGRLLHDVLLEARRAQVSGLLLSEPAEHEPGLSPRLSQPRLGDTVRIVGLRSAAQHNGTTGRVVLAPHSQQSDGGRVAVATVASPEGLLVKPSQLQLLRLDEESLRRLDRPARQLTFYLQEAENNEFDHAVLRAHGLELPLFFFHTYRKLRDLLDERQVSGDAHTRLAALQAAVREAPTLSLCGAYDDRVRRRCDLEEADLQPDVMEVEPNDGATFDAMILPAEPHNAEPHVIKVPLRTDYLHAITESLVSRAGGIGAPLGMYARHSGQKTEQPVLYFLIVTWPAEGHESADALPPRNERASQLAGYDIFGDAILADVELELPERHRAVSTVGVPACERFLAKELADPLAFTLASADRPLLGHWALPRLAAWPPTCRPKAVMEEFMEFMRRHHATTGRFVASSVWPLHTQADGSPQAHTPFVGAAYTNAWLLDGREPPPEARYDEEHQCHVLQSLPLPPPKKDAENDAVLSMMRALSDQTPSPPWVPIGEPRRIDGPAPETAAADGSAVECSYALHLENLDGSEGPENGVGVGDATASGTLLERQSRIKVVLGAGVLHPEVEGVLAELAGEWQARDASMAGPRTSNGSTHEATWKVRIRARYHGVDVSCLLTLTVHSVVRGTEESEYELAGGPSGLGALRRHKLHELLHELRPTCLADIGCGDGSLLLRMLDGGAPSTLSRLVGLDVQPQALKRGAKKLRMARENLMSSGAADPVPSVQMLCGSLADVDAARLMPRHGPDATARPTPPDVLTLIEVVEHLDPPELRELGPALLGRCAPRALIVTTPNKEYNLNRMVCCRNRTECQARRVGGIDEEQRRRMIATGELCKGCALFSSGQPPPLECYPLRAFDHRFEFTRSKFCLWAEELGRTYGYSVRYDGVGGGPFDEAYDPENCFHGPGPDALVCIFLRQETAGAPAALPMVSADAIGSSSSAAATLHCVWDSDEVECNCDTMEM